MRKRIDWNWEKLDEATFRVKVIGGWLVLHVNHTTITDGKKREIIQTESMQFVADRDHEWEIMPPIVDIQVKRNNIANDFKPVA